MTARVRPGLNGPEDVEAAFAAMNGAPAVLEAFVPFAREVSVIGARSLTGQVVCFDPAENVHRDGILHTSTVTTATARGIRTDAVLMTAKVLNTLDYVGVIGVENVRAAGQFPAGE